MYFLINIFSEKPFLNPLDLSGWIGWLTFLCLNIFLIWLWRNFNRPLTHTRRLRLAFLLISVPVTGLFFGIQFFPNTPLPQPFQPENSIGPIAMIFSALPWILAGGLLGPLGAGVIGGLCGVFEALWITHNPYTILEIALLAVFFAALISQRYRTPFYTFLRKPLIATLLLIPIAGSTIILSSMLTTETHFYLIIEKVVSALPLTMLALTVELIVAGSLTQGFFQSFLKKEWERPGALQPSPSERSIQARFLYSIAPWGIILVIVLIFGDWYFSTWIANRMIREKMQETAELTAEQVPYFLETGQSILGQIAEEIKVSRLLPSQIGKLFEQNFQVTPFYNQILLLNSEGKPIAGYPVVENAETQITREEQEGIGYALRGIPFQVYAVPPESGKTGGRVAFISPVYDSANRISRILIGRTDLDSNPFIQPILMQLVNFASKDGQGSLINEEGRVIIQPNPGLINSSFNASNKKSPFYYSTGGDGIRRLFFSRPVTNRDWTVLLAVPAYQVYDLALQTASIILVIIVAVTILVFAILFLNLRYVMGALLNLSTEATRVAQGNLDQAISTGGEDEIGKLRHAFEQIRLSLKARLDELNRLLIVSQGVGSSFEIGEAVNPVLEAALSTGADSVRIVLAPNVFPEITGVKNAPILFSSGIKKDLFNHLDEQILAYNKHQSRLVLANTSRPRVLMLNPNAPRPESVIAFALLYDEQYYGSLWLGFEKSHRFSPEEVRFLATLANQAAMAITNSRFYLDTELGELRLAAILAYNPDPVIVTDQHARLILANPAAVQLLEMPPAWQGQSLQSILASPELINLIQPKNPDNQSAEITLPGGQIFMATSTSVLVDNQPHGRVYLLRDVTQFKQLNTLKSEFVSTVSHDLRSPLMLMRGYATMLEMVGQLNENQQNYVGKIIDGVENMSRLINNLLDLSRIDARIGLQINPINIRDLVERIADFTQLQAAQKKITLISEVSPNVPRLLEVDQALLQQAINNLLDNAVKFSRPEGKIYLRIAHNQDRVLFEISDNGIGISPLDQPHLFEKFYRGAHNGLKEQRGSGLGLAIVKSIVELHGGQIWVDSQLGKGSTFTFSIPLNKQPERQH